MNKRTEKEYNDKKLVNRLTKSDVGFIVFSTRFFIFQIFLSL